MLTLADTVKQTLRKRKVRSLTEEYSEPWQGSKIGSLRKQLRAFSSIVFKTLHLRCLLDF